MEQQLNNFYDFVRELLRREVGYDLEVEPGRKFIRLVSKHGESRSVWCFVNKETGDILKAASFKAPAKHARGNIQNPDSYSKYHWTGSHYLRG